jgi:hypothetical protein
MPFTLVRLSRLELPDPLLMSLTRTVPVDVPSVFQSSVPLLKFVAVKNSVDPIALKLLGFELVEPE